MPFVKGDPRINRNGRPKSFDALRKLAQQLATETAKDKNGAPIDRDGHVVTQVEAILLKMMHENPERFIEIAYGKVPQDVNLNASGELTFDYSRFISAAVRPVEDSPAPGED